MILLKNLRFFCFLDTYRFSSNLHFKVLYDFFFLQFLFCLFLFLVTPAVAKVYSRLCTQQLQLAVFGIPYDARD